MAIRCTPCKQYATLKYECCAIRRTAEPKCVGQYFLLEC